MDLSWKSANKPYVSGLEILFYTSCFKAEKLQLNLMDLGWKSANNLLFQGWKSGTKPRVSELKNCY